MSEIAVLGASGFTGRLLVRALARRGARVVAAGRDVGKVERVVGDVPEIVRIERVDVDEPDGLERLVGAVEVVTTTVGPFVELGRPAFEHALRAGRHYVDSTGEQPFVRWAYGYDGAEDAAGTLVPACGFDSVPGDLLADVAAGTVDEPVEVHVAYLVRGRSIIVSRGTRRTMAELIDGTGLALRDGDMVEERFAERRRLAWFPKPVGPRHAAGFPGCEPLMVPRHVDDVRTVATYFALPTALAEAGQFLANLTRFEPVGRFVSRVLEMGPEGPSDEGRRTTRWGCVAEVQGADGEVARAWAYGHDIYAFTAESMAWAAERLAAGDARATGVASPAEAFEPVRFLDEMSAVTDLRWSVREPD